MVGERLIMTYYSPFDMPLNCRCHVIRGGIANLRPAPEWLTPDLCNALITVTVKAVKVRPSKIEGSELDAIVAALRERPLKKYETIALRFGRSRTSIAGIARANGFCASGRTA
jgi:hypothetical protein